MYICKKCSTRLNTYREVLKHYIKLKHYDYKLSGCNLVLSFAGSDKK